MKKAVFIFLAGMFFFFLEFILTNYITIWLKPDFLLLLIIFTNFLYGVRYSLLAAVWAGLLKESFGLSIFGVDILAYVLCAYLTTFLRPHIYHRGSRLSLLRLVFLVISFNFVVHLFLNLFFQNVNLVSALRFVYLPEVVLTLSCTIFTFQKLKQCVSRFYVY